MGQRRFSRVSEERKTTRARHRATRLPIERRAQARSGAAPIPRRVREWLWWSWRTTLRPKRASERRSARRMRPSRAGRGPVHSAKKIDVNAESAPRSDDVWRSGSARDAASDRRGSRQIVSAVSANARELDAATAACGNRAMAPPSVTATSDFAANAGIAPRKTVRAPMRAASAPAPYSSLSPTSSARSTATNAVANSVALMAGDPTARRRGSFPAELRTSGVVTRRSERIQPR
jgi:hypothetical protein